MLAGYYKLFDGVNPISQCRNRLTRYYFIVLANCQSFLSMLVLRFLEIGGELKCYRLQRGDIVEKN